MQARLTATRMHHGIRMYGYLFGESPVVYWSMRFYEDSWHPPIVVDFFSN